MGNAESIPVVSQFISLGQACAGDLEGALRTQEQFARQAIVVSQVNSLVHSCMGNNDEALRIQIEFAENTPVVGHIMSAVHASQGNFEKAEEVAINATIPIIETAEIAATIAGIVSPLAGGNISASAISSAVVAGIEAFTPKFLTKLRRKRVFDQILRGSKWMVSEALKWCLGWIMPGNNMLK